MFRFPVCSSTIRPYLTSECRREQFLEDGKEGTAHTGPIVVNKTGIIVIKIHAKPGAKQNSATDSLDEAVGVQIAAPPNGEAIAELVKNISKVLQRRKSQISVDRGSKSREKFILIDKSAVIAISQAIGLIKEPSLILFIWQKKMEACQQPRLRR